MGKGTARAYRGLAETFAQLYEHCSSLVAGRMLTQHCRAIANTAGARGHISWNPTSCLTCAGDNISVVRCQERLRCGNNCTDPAETSNIHTAVDQLWSVLPLGLNVRVALS